MGFPNMKHLDPEATGPPVQMTLYQEYEQNENDVKKQREGFIHARANMPNNTFIKLFTNFNEDPKQDELQSIQYCDQNYVESSIDSENEFDLKDGQLRIIYNPDRSKSLSKVNRTELAPSGFDRQRESDVNAAHQNIYAKSNHNSSIKIRQGSLNA
jgi:hypothetical protein